MVSRVAEPYKVSSRDPDADQQTVLLPFVKMKKQRVREAKGLGRGHTVSESQKFRLQAVPEIIIPLQDALSLEMNEI